MGYDGIHPTEAGYALIANEWIAFLNRETGTNLRPVAIAPFIFGTASSSVSSLARTSAAPAPAASAHTAGPAAPLSAFEFTQEAFDQLRSVFPVLSGR